jgi:hypothetical protein
MLLQDIWDNDFLDLVEEAHITFRGSPLAPSRRSGGPLRLPRRFGLRGVLLPRRRFRTRPRGWVILGTADRIVGYFYIHKGDDLSLRCRTRLTSSKPARRGPADGGKTQSSPFELSWQAGGLPPIPQADGLEADEEHRPEFRFPYSRRK